MKYQAKKISSIIGLMVLSSFATVGAQEIIPVDEEISVINAESIDYNNGNNENNETLGNQTSSQVSERTLNDLILTSGGQLSQKVIEEISSLQEERSLLEARINTAESRQKFIEIERKIREMGGDIEDRLPVMLGSHGVNGNLKAVIEYNDKRYEVSRGSFIDSSWVVRKITKDKVEFLNIDDERKMFIGIGSPSFIR